MIGHQVSGENLYLRPRLSLFDAQQGEGVLRLASPIRRAAGV
jgi:hypothetical protein